jgi:hypothetical protein
VYECSETGVLYYEISHYNSPKTNKWENQRCEYMTLLLRIVVTMVSLREEH